jgi:hypothetical protein
VEAREAQVGLHVPLRVDDRGLAGAHIPDEIRGAAEVLVDHLAEQHE